MDGVRFLLAGAAMVLACGAPESYDPRDPDRKALYVVVTANQELCEEIAEECRKHWHSTHAVLGTGDCDSYLIDKAWPKRVRVNAALAVIQELERRAGLDAVPTTRLSRNLADLVGTHRKTCDLPESRKEEFSPFQATAGRLENHFRTLQRRILDELSLSEIEIEKLYDRWERRIAEKEDELYDRRARLEAATQRNDREEWERYVESQERRQRERAERLRRLRQERRTGSEPGDGEE